MAPSNCLSLKPGECYQANFDNRTTITICPFIGPATTTAPSFLISIFDNSSLSEEDAIRKSTMSLVADKESMIKQIRLGYEDVDGPAVNTAIVRAYFSSQEIVLFEQVVEVINFVKNLAK